MSRRRRRQVEIFNLSFLDVVSCGFGAIILLLVIVKTSEPAVIEKLSVDLRGLVTELSVQAPLLRGETEVLNRELDEKQRQLSIHKEKLARLSGDLSSIRGKYATTKNDHNAKTRIEAYTPRVSASSFTTAVLRPKPEF